MVDVTSVSSLIDTTTSVPSTVQPNPTAAQQAAFQQAFVAAQLGSVGPTSNVNASTATPGDVQHLVQFSFFQNTLLNCMAEVEANRQKASQDDD